MNLQLHLPTNRTVTGPKFQKAGQQIIVEYDYEQTDGSVKWTRIVFDEILMFEYRQISCCNDNDIVGAKEMRCLSQSQDLKNVITRWQQSVGWQDWQCERGGAQRFKQYTLFFDDDGCVNVIAANCRIAD